MAAEIPLEGPWQAENADTWDAQTLESWLLANAKTEVGLGYWRTMVPALFSAEAAEMSLLHFLFYCRSGGTLDRLVATHDGAQESRLEGGSQRLASLLADRLGDAVRLGAPVTTIRQDEEGVEVTYDGGGVVKAARAIVALPPTLAARIRYSPALPPLRDQLTQQVPMGYVIKVQIAYPEPFWRAEGLSGSVFSLDDEVSVIFDNSPQDLSCGVLLGFLEGRHGRRAGKLAPEQRKELILSVFAKFFGSRAADPEEYVERDWAAEEWSRGCYGGRFGTGVWTGYGEALREPVGRIHWAGTETAEVWNGYMDGAVRSGERAAHEVLTS
jgi:monoamine oxidase